MKIIAFNGSPKGKNSVTHIMLENILNGAAAEGAEVEEIFLVDHEIRHCMGCFNCWFKTPGKCVINDGMAALTEKYRDVDVIILASPLYGDNVTGIMKDFLDRTIVDVDPSSLLNMNSEGKPKTTTKKVPKLVIVSNCGYAEQSSFQVLHLLFERMARNMNSELIAEIYRSQGPLLSEKSIMLKLLLSGYKRLLHKAGQQIARDLQLTPELTAKLEQPLIPVKRYIEESQKHFAKALKGVKE